MCTFWIHENSILDSYKSFNYAVKSWWDSYCRFHWNDWSQIGFLALIIHFCWNVLMKSVENIHPCRQFRTVLFIYSAAKGMLETEISMMIMMIIWDMQLRYIDEIVRYIFVTGTHQNFIICFHLCFFVDNFMRQQCHNKIQINYGFLTTIILISTLAENGYTASTN